MRYTTQLEAQAGPEEIFDAFHRYKTSEDPSRFFPSRLSRMDFHVVTKHTLGVGAIYDWRIWALGIPVLKFREQVVEWEAAKAVAYKAISGWEMYFRVDLKPKMESTLVTVAIDFSLGVLFLDRLFRPFIEWGLNRVCRRGLRKEGISAAKMRLEPPPAH